MEGRSSILVTLFAWGYLSSEYYFYCLLRSEKLESVPLLIRPSFALANAGIQTAFIVIASWNRLMMLKPSSKRGQRINQPSLARVNLQGGGVLFHSVVVVWILLFYIMLVHMHWRLWVLVKKRLVFGCFLFAIGVAIFVNKRRGCTPPMINGSYWREDRAIRVMNGSNWWEDRAIREFSFDNLLVPVLDILITLLCCEIFYVVFFGTGKELSDHAVDSVMFIQPVISCCIIMTKLFVKTRKNSSRRNDKKEMAQSMDGRDSGIACRTKNKTKFGFVFPFAGAEQDTDSEEDSVDVTANNSGNTDNRNDDNDVDMDGEEVESGIPREHDSRRIRRGSRPTIVLTTGEAAHMMEVATGNPRVTTQ